MAEFLAKNQTKGVVCFNSIAGNGRADIHVVDLDLQREFYAIEFEHTHKLKLNLQQIGESFFGQNGPRVKKLRGAFTEIFHIKRMSTKIETMYETVVDNIKSEFKNETGYKKIDLKKLIGKSMADITEKLLFGISDLTKAPKVNGMTFSQVTNKAFVLNRKVSFNPINKLFLNLPQKLGLLKDARDHKFLIKESIKVAHKEYMKRVDSEEDEADVLGLLAKFLKQTGEEMKPSEIAANIRMFYFAGSDTSNHTTSSAMLNLLFNPELLEKLREAINRDVWSESNSERKGSKLLNEKIESCEYLSKVFKETLRRAGPSPFLFARKVVKPFKLGDIQIRRGDAIFIPTGVKMMSDLYFENSEKFDPERFSSENKKKIPKLAYVPFSSGPRICLGSAMGELLVKVTLIAILDHLELERPEDLEWKYVLEPLTTPAAVTARARLIKR